MATKLYLLAAANALTGTFPAVEQSSQTASWSATGSSSLLTMRATKGSGQGSLSGNSLANTSPQSAFCGFFASDTLSANQSVGGGSNTITLNIANLEASLNMNFGADLRCNVYVWRPSTGAKVGTVCDNLPSSGSQEPGAAVSIRTNISTITGSSTVSALAGDVIICEIWQNHTQSSATVYTGAIYANGTTETLTANTVVANHASFIEFSADNLTFGASGVNATLAVTLANDSASSASVAGIAAQSAVTMQSDAVSGQGQASVSGSASLTNQGDSVSSQVSSQSSISASLAIQLANDQASSLSSVAISAQSSLAIQSDSVSSALSTGVSASLLSQVANDSSSSSSAVLISADAQIDESSDSASSESSLEIYASLFAANADDIMSASASSGEVEFSLERTLFIGAQVRISPVNAQPRQFYPVAQNRVASMISQNRTSAPEAQNRTLAPEPQNRNIAE